MGLIEDNEINNNTLAGVWITTGKYPGHVTTINYLHFLNGNFNKVITSGAAVGFFKGGGGEAETVAGYLGFVNQWGMPPNVAI